MCLQFDNISQNVRLGDDLKVNLRFESFVYLIRYKTLNTGYKHATGLRALLI